MLTLDGVIDAKDHLEMKRALAVKMTQKSFKIGLKIIGTKTYFKV